MRTRDFLEKLQHDRIVHAIAAAEAKTSGQIRVFVQRGELDGDAFQHAQRKFRKLGMEKTRERNAVLIFVAPRARKFAVIGDEGVHRKCGDDFWEQLVVTMREHFRNDNFQKALVEAIDQTGEVLATHFPKKARDSGNELPDDVVQS
jgi:uncharacterized membrane protein